MPNNTAPLFIAILAVLLLMTIDDADSADLQHIGVCTTQEAHEQELNDATQRGYSAGYNTGYDEGGTAAMIQLAAFVDAVCKDKGSGFLIMTTREGGTGIVCQ